MKNNEKGISLIALVITVIVLLILATAVLSFALDQDNLITKTKEAKQGWNEKVEEDNTVINYVTEQLNQSQGLI